MSADPNSAAGFLPYEEPTEIVFAGCFVHRWVEKQFVRPRTVNVFMVIAAQAAAVIEASPALSEAKRLAEERRATSPAFQTGLARLVEMYEDAWLASEMRAPLAHGW